MEALEIARWQFGITTVYHFMMVPLTIGLGLVVAVMQTLWHRTGKVEYLHVDLGRESIRGWNFAYLAWGRSASHFSASARAYSNCASDRRARITRSLPRRTLPSSTAVFTTARYRGRSFPA